MEGLVKGQRLLQLNGEQIESRLSACPLLPSLGSINKVLCQLLEAERCYTSQVAEVVRLDPSLTTRLLRLVNSVFYNLSTPVSSIDEAVFYLGVCQIRRLAVVTPLIEDLEKVMGHRHFPWAEFWRHCIATASTTSEILGDLEHDPNDSHYVAGLLHDVGKIVIAAAFPEYFDQIQAHLRQEGGNLLQIETDLLGMDHCELGARYLAGHDLPDSTVSVVRFHHHPKAAPNDNHLVAAVQIADLYVRHARIGNSGDSTRVSAEDCENAEGWDLLFPATEARTLARANIESFVHRLSGSLNGPE
jgi:putative nucleotidyltransferase with HDIG domain